MTNETLLAAIIVIVTCSQFYVYWALGQILSDLARHEVALLELIRMHPEMIYSEEAEIFNESE